MATKPAVSVRIRGKEFRIRGDDDPEALQRVAGYLDETMARVEQRTGSVDSLDIALLTALNLAREVVELRGERTGDFDPGRLRSLIEMAESALAAPPAGSASPPASA